jgi:hypothetical protein
MAIDLDGSGRQTPTVPTAPEAAAEEAVELKLSPAGPHPRWGEGGTFSLLNTQGADSGISSGPSPHFVIPPDPDCLFPSDLHSSLLLDSPGLTAASNFNTTIRYPLFTPHTLPMPASPLKKEGWRALLLDHPNRELVDTLLGIITYGAWIGYEGPRRSHPVIYDNLLTAALEPPLVTADLQKQLAAKRLKIYDNSATLPTDYVASPLGLTDKSDGTKRRIHHLSFPPNSPSESINGNIPTEYGTLQYATMDNVISILSQEPYGLGSILVKRDLEDAFRHIPVSPLDWPLLGFSWASTFYADCFLPFGLRTAPYIFNLFAEAFHWILQQALTPLHARVVHYLDDFLFITPPGTDWTKLDVIIANTANTLGLSIKEKKNRQGTTVDFCGLEVDTTRYIIQLPAEKKEKALRLLRPFIQFEPSQTPRTSISLGELQSLTGFLAFTSYVVPLGRTFTRRLYNRLFHFPPGRPDLRRRVSSEVRKDIQWWYDAVNAIPSRAIPQLGTTKPPGVQVFSDASSLKGLGGFFLKENETMADLTVEKAFSVALPRHILQRKPTEHINTRELRAVEQCLLHWGQSWAGHSVQFNVDNTVALHGINNRTTRGEPMKILRRLLLLAATFQIHNLQAVWIPSEENALADALSRWDRNRIADLCPQLLPLLNSRPLALSHPRHGTATSTH